jgi:hypothetical protein
MSCSNPYPITYLTAFADIIQNCKGLFDASTIHDMFQFMPMQRAKRSRGYSEGALQKTTGLFRLVQPAGLHRRYKRKTISDVYVTFQFLPDFPLNRICGYNSNPERTFRCVHH